MQGISSLHTLQSKTESTHEKSAGYGRIRISADNAVVKCRYYSVRNAQRAVLCLSGERGGWDTPGQDLYPRLGTTLQNVGIAVLQMRYREENDLEMCVADALAV